MLKKLPKVLSAGLAIVLMVNVVAFAAHKVCVSDKEHLKEPTGREFYYSVVEGGRRGRYAVDWHSAYLYSRCIFRKKASDPKLHSDSGRVYGMHQSIATAYGKAGANADGYWGHNCQKSR